MVYGPDAVNGFPIASAANAGPPDEGLGKRHAKRVGLWSVDRRRIAATACGFASCAAATTLANCVAPRANTSKTLCRVGHRPFT